MRTKTLEAMLRALGPPNVRQEGSAWLYRWLPPARRPQLSRQLLMITLEAPAGPDWAKVLITKGAGAPGRQVESFTIAQEQDLPPVMDRIIALSAPRP